MKKKLITALSILAIFGFAIVAYAFTQNTTPVVTKASCCGDSCPMKKKGHEGHDANGEHAKMDCCKKHDGDHANAEAKNCCGDSCPMKSRGDGSASAAAENRGCCDCCGDSCPMKKGDENATAAEGKCCCDCCKEKKDTSV